MATATEKRPVRYIVVCADGRRWIVRGTFARAKMIYDKLPRGSRITCGDTGHWILWK